MEFCMPKISSSESNVKNTNFKRGVLKTALWLLPLGSLFLFSGNDAKANPPPHGAAAPARPAFGGRAHAFGGGAPHGFGGDARGFGGMDRGHDFADNRGFEHGFADNRGFGHDHYAFRGHDVHHFDHDDMMRWRGGHWNNTCFAGRCGWWWLAGGTWYYYDQPVYPYPLVVPGTTYVEPEPMESDAPAPLAVAPPPKFRYYCSNPPGYYPQVPNCNGQYQEQPAG
jgi:hypothetical protein